MGLNARQNRAFERLNSRNDVQARICAVLEARLQHSCFLASVYLHKARSLPNRGQFKERVIPINPILKRLLIECLDQAGLQPGFSESDRVVSGFPWGVPCRLLTGLCKGAGVKHLSFHGFRHSFASMLVMEGVPLYDVQALLGHSDFRVTQRYAHLAPDHLNGVTDRLSFGRDINLDGSMRSNVVSLNDRARLG